MESRIFNPRKIDMNPFREEIVFSLTERYAYPPFWAAAAPQTPRNHHRTVDMDIFVVVIDHRTMCIYTILWRLQGIWGAAAPQEGGYRYFCCCGFYFVVIPRPGPGQTKITDGQK